MSIKIRVYIYIIFLILLSSCFFIVKKIYQKNMTEAIIATIPNFSFLSQKNQSFSNINIDNTKSRIIINYFSPNCENCQYMADELLKDSHKLKNIQILMITSANSTSTTKFKNDYKLSLLPNIIILRDTNYMFQKIFGTGIVPSFFIYEKNKLIKKVNGETKIENLIY